MPVVSPTRDANLSLVLGLLSLVLTLLTSVPAIVFGRRALRSARATGQGRGRAIAGLVLGIVMTVFSVVLLSYAATLIAGAISRIGDPPVPGALDTAVLEGEVQREVLGQDDYDRDRTDCELVVPRPGATTTCVVAGERYTVTFVDGLAFDVEPG